MKRYDFDQVWYKYESTPSIEAVEDANGEYVLYSEAQQRIDALEWLVECECSSYWGARVSELAWIELYETYRAARAAAGVKP